MKKFNYLSMIIILTFLLAVPVNSFAGVKGNNGDNSKKPRLNKTALDPQQSLIDINNITSWVTQEGFHDWVVASSWNGAFPNGASVGAIFSEGIVWGGQVHDGSTPVVRVNGNTYGTGCSPITRLYRVRPDYETGDLTQDAADFNNIPLGAVTDADIQSLRDQYAKDWNEWPADKGAPYKDVNNDGQYEPSVDIPGIPGASQTLFIMYNDNISSTLYGSPPIGLEVSETYWAYAYSGALGNVIYKKVDIVYKGTPSSASNSTIDSMFIVQWADPDVGTSTDDFAGCDTTLNLGYAYNSSATDATYQGLNLAPPAVGYDFLQGVSHYTGNANDSAIFNLKWRHGYAYVNPKPMSSFAYFAAGGTWEDPDFTYTGSLQFYNLMRGYLPRPPYPATEPFPESVADVTPFGTYLLDGDPVAGTGKIDGSVDGPGDRRIMVTNGPITMNLGDTAQVVLALVGGLGSDNLSSVSAMKTNDNTAQIVFDQLFQLPSLPPPDVNIAELDKKIVLDWGSNTQRVQEDEQFSDQGYDFQGYEVYQLPSSSSQLSDGVRLATFDLIDGITAIYDTVTDANGQLIPELSADGKDAGIQRYLNVTTDPFRQTALRNGQEYYFAVVAYAYRPAPLLPFHVLRSPAIIRTAVPQLPQPGFTIPETGNLSDITHTGTANASIDVKVVDPKLLTGDDYEVYFDTKSYTLGSDGIWKIAGSSNRFGKDLTGSSLSSSASWSEKQGSMDVHYMVNVVSPDYDWCDGVEIFFPSNVVIDTTYGPISNNDGSSIGFTINRANNSIFYGDSTRSQNGLFAGGEDIVVTVHPAAVPMIVNYNMYDDGYGGNIVDVSGTDTLQGPIAEKIITQKHWNVKDVTTGNVVLQNQTILSGTDIYAPELYFTTHFFDGPGGSSGSRYSNVGKGANAIFDGLQVAVNGSYTAPTTIGSLELNGQPLAINSGSYFQITDFTYFGYDGTAANTLPLYGGAGGTTDINLLQQDYELRWTGVLGDTTINGVTIKITKSGGQMLTLFGASGYSLADHPLNPNPGTDAPFNVRVPFEVWNVDKNEQVNVLFWDRSGDPTQTGGMSWNTEDREYLWCVNTKYDAATVIDPTSQTVADSSTWNWVIYLSHFTLGDVVKISYDNPLQTGQDKFTFSTKSMKYNNSQAKEDVSKINVFPNPYYGYQYRETSRDQHYVTFSHLPPNAVIRIFDLSGVLVKTITHVPSSGQFDRWTLQNDEGYPVASGIYVVYIDMPDLGATKILKLAIVQEQQILKVY